MVDRMTDENYTPNTPEQPVIDLVLKVFGGEIDLDPCSNSLDNPNVPAKYHITKELAVNYNLPWKGKVYLNPPYSNPKPFLKWLCYSFENGYCTEAIALLKTGAIHNKGTGRLIEEYASAIFFWGAGKTKHSRIGFINQDGVQRNGADFDCICVYFGSNPEKFKEVFSAYGHVMRTMQ